MANGCQNMEMKYRTVKVFVIHLVKMVASASETINVNVERTSGELIVNMVCIWNCVELLSDYITFADASVCTPAKLNFNGGYNCSGSLSSLNCVLYCPQGIEFSSEPAPIYTCPYETGVFQPQPIPQCQISSNMQLIKTNRQSYSSYKTYSREELLLFDWSSIIYGKHLPFTENVLDI